MTACPEVRKAILGNMAHRLQKYQSVVVQQEKMASLGTLAAGLMHELNNPGAAAVRAAAQLRANLMRMHQLTAKFSKASLNDEQKQCMFELQEYALSKEKPVRMNSLEQSDAEETLAEWMESANVEDAWKLAPALVSIGIDSSELECARSEFPGPFFSDALSWLEALVSSMQLVSTIEESIGRVSDLVKAVKSYAYEGKGQKQAVDINESIHATLVILTHKIREKQITIEKDFAASLPALQCECSGLNQIWTNILDNAIDAVAPGGHIRVRTWEEDAPANAAGAGSQAPPLPLHHHRRRRPRHPAGEPGPHLRSLLHHQARRRRHRPRPRHRAAHHRAVRRPVTFASEPGNTEFRIRLPRDRD